MKALYVSGTDRSRDALIAQQLGDVRPPITIDVTADPLDALTRIRDLHTAEVLVLSPSLTRAETLALIVSLRRDRAPVAILPVVTEAQQDFATAVVSAGADDVLLLLGGTLVHAHEMFARVRQSAHVRRPDHRHRLRVLYAGADPLVWSLIEQTPFVDVARAPCDAAGGYFVRLPAAPNGEPPCDLVVIDELPDLSHQQRAVAAVRGQAPDMSILTLTPPRAADRATVALGLRQDEVIVKTGLYRRPLVAALQRAYEALGTNGPERPPSPSRGRPFSVVPPGTPHPAPADHGPETAAGDTGMGAQRAPEPGMPGAPEWPLIEDRRAESNGLRREVAAARDAAAAARTELEEARLKLETARSEASRAERMSRVGALAMRMAPDLAEVLSSAAESASALGRDLEGQPERKRHAEAIAGRLSQAVALVQQLLSFSRQQARQPDPVDLGLAVSRAEPMLGRLAGSAVALEVHAQTSEAVAVREEDLEQLLTALVVSARTLLPIGGSVRIETSRHDPRPEGSHDAFAAAQGEVVLAVTAEGHGVLAPQPTDALASVAERCGASIRVHGQTGRTAVIEIAFPLCA